MTHPLVLRPYSTSPRRSWPTSVTTAVTISDASIEIAVVGMWLRDYTIEPDASSASYPLAAAAICGGRGRGSGLTSSLQGDARLFL